jgi:hypothetical protein
MIQFTILQCAYLGFYMNWFTIPITATTSNLVVIMEYMMQPIVALQYGIFSILAISLSEL